MINKIQWNWSPSLEDEREMETPKFRIGGLVRTSKLSNTVSKGDATIWSYGLYTITKIVDDTKPSYSLDSLPESSNEALFKKTTLTKTQNENATEKVEIFT